MMKKGITPVWYDLFIWPRSDITHQYYREDPTNQRGGIWSIRTPKDKTWVQYIQCLQASDSLLSQRVCVARIVARSGGRTVLGLTADWRRHLWRHCFYSTVRACAHLYCSDIDTSGIIGTTTLFRFGTPRLTAMSTRFATKWWRFCPMSRSWPHFTSVSARPTICAYVRGTYTSRTIYALLMKVTNECNSVQSTQSLWYRRTGPRSSTSSWK